MTIHHAMGWLPDVPKPSDYTPEHPEVAPLLQRTSLVRNLSRTRRDKERGSDLRDDAAQALPSTVDLRTWFSPIEDQGHLGSCTANAAAALLEYFEKRTANKYIDASRLFLYKAERNLLGWTGDTGAFLRTAMEALVLFGAPPEKYWPYDGRAAASNTRFDVEPSAFAYAFGDSYKALRYFRLDQNGAPATHTLANIRAFLASGFPSMFGFPVYSEYDSPLPGDLVAFPAPGSHYRGGHANVVAGYDDNLMIGADKGALLIRNSWGTAWGNAGYAWMSYRYVTAGLAVDWWSMISANWVNTTVFA